MSSSIAALNVPALPSEQLQRLAEVASVLDPAQLYWASGYLYGRAHRLDDANGSSVPESVAQPSQILTVAYGSQTGNSRRLAEQLAARAEASGIGVHLLSLADLRARELPELTLLYVVVSTQGDGDPPDDARRFFDEVHGKRAPKLAGLRFAVLALGDSSYPQFCSSGRQLDDRLAELGGHRLLDRLDVDLDFERESAPWLASALQTAERELINHAADDGTTPAARHNHTPQLHLVRTAAATNTAAVKSIHSAAVILRQPLTTERAVRPVQHLELDIAGSGIHYEPGDALAIHLHNDEASVAAVLAAVALDGDAVVELDGECLSLRRWLAERRELTRLSLRFLREHAARGATDNALAQLLADSDHQGIRPWYASRQLQDVLREVRVEWTPDDLVRALPPLATRAYSIASSRSEVGDDDVHLSVAELFGQHADRDWRGLASGQLARLGESARVQVSVEANPRFRLPADASRDILMIGAGTGVAPYRAFLQERIASGAAGRNWLLFGNRHAREDFLYQAEWLDALRRGGLQRLDVAFSRDGGEHRYVQDRLREHGRAVFDWIESGASIYVCGDAQRMAPDLHAALQALIADHAGVDAEDARDRLNQLAANGRYLRDVY